MLVGGPRSRLGRRSRDLLELAGKRPVPIDLDMQLRSEDGRVVVESGGGTVAGLPAGLLAQVITSAIVVRL